jgi:quinol monooxygenase YgiN
MSAALRGAVVRLTVVLVASGRSAPRLEEALRSLMIPAMLEEGCLECSTWVDPDCAVHYQEDWATEAHMRDRVQSDQFTRLLAVIEASEKQPRVQFDFVTITRGLDYVEEVRLSSAAPARRANVRGEY